MSMLMIFNMVLSTFFHVLSLKYSTLKIFVSVQLVAKVTAFPAMTASPATSMTSYTSTGYGPAAKVPGSPTGSLGGCTSPDRYIITASLNWAQCGNFRNFHPHTFLHEINFGDCQNFTWRNMIGRKLVTFHTVLGSRYFLQKTLLNMPFWPFLSSTTVVLPNGFEASLYDEFLSSGSKRYQYIPQQVSQPQPFLPQHLQQQQQQHRRGYGGLVIKREEDPYSRFVQYLTVCKKFHFT